MNRVWLVGDLAAPASVARVAGGLSVVRLLVRLHDPNGRPFDTPVYIWGDRAARAMADEALRRKGKLSAVGWLKPVVSGLEVRLHEYQIASTRRPDVPLWHNAVVLAGVVTRGVSSRPTAKGLLMAEWRMRVARPSGGGGQDRVDEIEVRSFGSYAERARALDPRPGAPLLVEGRLHLGRGGLEARAYRLELFAGPGAQGAWERAAEG